MNPDGGATMATVVLFVFVGGTLLQVLVIMLCLVAILLEATQPQQAVVLHE